MRQSLLWILSSIALTSVSAQTATVTVSNSTGDYFIVEDSVTGKSFTCPASKGCYIHCKLAHSCGLARILPSSGGLPTWLHIVCTGGESCASMLIVAQPTESADIICSSSSGQACHGAEFTLTSTPTVNVRCDNGEYIASSSGYGACYQMALTATNAVDFNLDCMTNYDCDYATITVTDATSAVINGYGSRSLYYAEIHGANAASLEVYCNSYSSCYGLKVYAPSQAAQEYAFMMYCAPVLDSCIYVKVYMISPDVMTTNFMELLCPQLSLSSSCDIDFICSGTTVGSYMTFDSGNNRFKCNDQDCCPWTDYDAIVQNTSDLAFPGAIAPTFDNGTVQVFDMDGTESYPVISCTATEECVVNCLSAPNVCEDLPIYAGATKRLSLQCRAADACVDVFIAQGPTEQADIVCFTRGGGSCYSAVFLLRDTPVVNLLCDNNGLSTTSSTDGSCANMLLRADNAAAVNIDCLGRYDCKTAAFHVSGVASIRALEYRSFDSGDLFGSTAGSLDLDCYGDYSCYSVQIYPPYDSEYAFKLRCSSFLSSCSSTSVTVPSYSAPVANYMELDCPRVSGRCDVDWVCLDLSTSYSTTTSFSSTRGLYVCNDQDCCPWTDYDDVIQSSTQVQPFESAIAPTSVDSDGEHYVFDSDAATYRVINCNDANGCYITCSFGSACEYMQVYAAQTSYLEISCFSADACRYMYVAQGPIGGEANIQCVSDRGGACEYATLVMEETPTVNLNCDNLQYSTTTHRDGNCEYLTLRANGADNVQVICKGYTDCEYAKFYVESVTTLVKIVGGPSYRALYNADIYAVNAAKLNVTCLADACYQLDVYPPYLQTYDFALYCIGEDACTYVEVYVPNRVDAAVDNYMQFICPTEDASDCDVDWNCEDTGEYSSSSYNSDDEQVQCSSYNDGCCPWVDFGYRESPRECTFVDGAFCGHTLFSRGYNIWKLASSDSYVLDVDQINNNTELYSDAGSTCTLSSLQFTSSYGEYSSFASSDSTSISGEYASEENSAGGSLSQARERTKSFATSSQSYIYTMSLSCQAATVSLAEYTSLYLNANFVNALTLLPATYSSSLLNAYTSFWDTYGTHIVKTAKLGGSIRGAVTANKCLVDNAYSSSDSYEVCLNAAYQGEGVDGCVGDSDSESSGTEVSSSVTNMQITVRGGETSEFSNIFNQFSEKSNEFQDWIRDLAVFPDIIGGDLEAIHAFIDDTIALGGADVLNNALSSPLSDAEWQSIAAALRTAFDEYSTTLAAADIEFEDCAITCNEGTVDTSTCTCNGCSSSLGCCPAGTTDPGGDSTAAATFYTVPWVHVLVAAAAVICALQ